MDEKAIEATKKLMVLLKDQHLVGEYIRRFGLTINAKNIAEVKARKSGTRPLPTATGPNPALAARQAAIAAQNKANAAAMAAKAAASRPKGSLPPVDPTLADDSEQDPVFQTTVNCPICGQTGITSYELRAKSQQMVQTALLVPVYTGAAGFKTVDYSNLAVAVCPKCLFASPDRKNFNYPSFTGNKEEKSSLNVSVILALKDKTGERRQLLPAALNAPDYFKREREPRVAIESYRLAMARAETEAELMQPYAYFKMGSYALKIARIMKIDGQDDTGVLREALALFEKSFSKSECETDELEMQVVYLITTLYIKLRELTQANSYLGVFGKLISERQEAMKKNPALNTHWIEKWQERARFNWEERDNKEYFDN
jgi:uncharacterized protein (DUF2225 family)